MPKRPEKKNNQQTVDLAFLPEALLVKINDVFDRYFKLGFSRNTQVIDEDNIPNFPNNVSSLSSAEVGDFHARYTAWYSYVNDKLKYLKVALMVVDKEAEQTMNTEIVNITMDVTKKYTVSEKEAKAKISQGYMAISSYKMQLETLVSMLERDMDSYDKNITTLSREFSRREHGGF